LLSCINGWTYVFFAECCGTGALKANSMATRMDSGAGFDEIDRIAKAASIQVITS
jgi:hypothetical protein